MERVDIFISGGGLAGLIAAASFGQAGFSVCLADPSPPPANDANPAADLRTTAYLRPSRDLIDRAGLWDALAPYATPLETLRIVDTARWPPEIRETRDFRSDDLGDAPFGWNLPNWRARVVLADAIAQLPRVSLRLGTGFARLVSRETEALVTLTDGSRLRAKVAIAADGRNSALREAAGIGTETTRYGQKALAFSVTHPESHGNTSTEIYNQGGAFTLVPAPDQDGTPCSSVVWMNDGPRATDLQRLDRTSFEAVLTERSCGVLGPLSLASERQMWPVVTQRADDLAAQRVALIAEAAHVMPPIGAQGLNTSLQDVGTLLSLAMESPEAVGSASMLAAYARARGRDIAARARVIDLFNRVCMSGEAPIQSLRLAGLRAVHGLTPIRRAVMRAGLGG